MSKPALVEPRSGLGNVEERLLGALLQTPVTLRQIERALDGTGRGAAERILAGARRLSLVTGGLRAELIACAGDAAQASDDFRYALGLGRVAFLGASIAEQFTLIHSDIVSTAVRPSRSPTTAAKVGEMTGLLITQVQNSLAAFAQRDLDAVRTLRRERELVIEAGRDIFQTATTLNGGAAVSEAVLGHARIATCLERISDSAVAIADTAGLVD